jgi:hypothetical protein
MGLFGASKKEIWTELAEEIQANYIEGALLKGSRIEYKHRHWTIYLDTYTVSTGQSSVTYTRMRVPFIYLKDMYFKIYKKSIFSSIGKSLGMQDIAIGNNTFDQKYILKGNDEAGIKSLFLDSTIRLLIETQSRFKLEIKDRKKSGITNERELIFITSSVIKDKERLKNLFELFKKIMDELERKVICATHAPENKLYIN